MTIDYPLETNYAANARLWQFDIHYQLCKFGTVPEIPD